MIRFSGTMVSNERRRRASFSSSSRYTDFFTFPDSSCPGILRPPFFLSFFFVMAGRVPQGRNPVKTAKSGEESLTPDRHRGRKLYGVE